MTRTAKLSLAMLCALPFINGIAAGVTECGVWGCGTQMEVRK
jgi:hypothetical protein